MAKKITLIGLETIPIIKPGDDLAKVIFEALKREKVDLDDGDILVIAQKIVSKAENRILDLRDLKPSKKAVKLASLTGKDPRFIEAVLTESDKVVKALKDHIIVKTRLGLVCSNAGVDISNVSGNDNIVCLLPVDPDKSAEEIRKKIEKLTGKKVGVLITDTFGRPLRDGQVDVTIGLSNVKPFRDYRGSKDMKGYTLQVKNIAVADELASAAELLIGQGKEKIPVVVVKGLNELVDEGKFTARVLNMPEERWLFK